MEREVATAEARRYGRAAGVLSIGVGSAGLLTYLYFAFASHTLGRDAYGEIVALWALVFLTVVTLYRPIEQLLSRTIAERQAYGQPIGPPLRVAATIQLSLAAAFAIAVLLARGPLEDRFSEHHGTTLYWVFVAAVLAYAASFFARGFFAGHRRFVLYSLLLLLESSSRVLFALAVVIGVGSGQSLVALGIVAAPCFSLLVVPMALHGRLGGWRRARAASRRSGDSLRAAPAFTLAQGGGFAAAVLVIMLSEQTLFNAGVLVVKDSAGAAAAGFIFNVLMVARAPLVLFQAFATSLLPHLTRLRSRTQGGGDRAFTLSVQATIGLVIAFTAVVALVVTALGPGLMQLAFGTNFAYDRAGLLIVTCGMGLYLSAVTLNQAAVAQGQVRRAAACYAICAVGFVTWSVLPILGEFRRIEVGFAATAGILCGLLFLLFRRPQPRAADVVRPDSPEELEARLAAADEAG
jgi:O-antigen/teichoic acid export membrane protein